MSVRRRFSLRARIDVPTVYSAFIRALQSHSVHEITSYISFLQGFVVLDEVAEAGFKEMKKTIEVYNEVLKFRFGFELPSPDGTLANWYRSCVQQAKELSRRDPYGGALMLVHCCYFAIRSRAIVRIEKTVYEEEVPGATPEVE